MRMSRRGPRRRGAARARRHELAAALDGGASAEVRGMAPGHIGQGNRNWPVSREFAVGPPSGAPRSLIVAPAGGVALATPTGVVGLFSRLGRATLFHA